MKKKLIILVPLVLLMFSLGFSSDFGSAETTTPKQKNNLDISIITITNDGSEYRQALDHPIRVDFTTDPTIAGNIRIDMLLNTGERVNVCPGECALPDGTGEFYFKLNENPLAVGESAAVLNPLFDGFMIYDETDESSAVSTGDYFLVDSFFDVFFDITVTDVDRYNAEQQTMKIRGVVVDPEVRAEDVKISALMKNGSRRGVCGFGKCFASPGYVSFDWDPQSTFPGMSDLEIAEVLVGLIVEDATDKSKFTGIYSEKASFGGSRGLDILIGGSGNDRIPLIGRWPPLCPNCSYTDNFPYGAAPEPSFTVASFFDVDYTIDFSLLNNNFGINTAHPFVVAKLNNPDFTVEQTGIDVVLNTGERFSIAANAAMGNPSVLVAEFDPNDIFPGWSVEDLNSQIERIEIYPTDEPARLQSLDWGGQFQVDSFFDVTYRIDYVESSCGTSGTINPSNECLPVVPLRGFMQSNIDLSNLEVFVEMQDGTRSSICGPCTFNMGTDGLSIAELEDYGYPQEQQMWTLDWTPSMTFPEMSLSELNENIVGIGVGEIDDPSSFYLEPVDSFFDVFFDITIETHEFTHPLDKATPLLAKVADPKIPDAAVVIDLIRSDGTRENICNDSCATNGDVYFEFLASDWFAGLEAFEVNLHLDGFLIYNRDNDLQSLRLPDHHFVDSFFDVTYQIDFSPHHPKYAANDIIPFFIRIADLGVDPKDVDISVAPTPSSEARSLCNNEVIEGTCEAEAGYLVRLQKRPDLLTAEWDELIDSSIENLDPVIKVSGGEPYDEFAFKVRDHYENLDHLVPPPSIAVGWNIRAGSYQFETVNFAEGGQKGVLGRYPVHLHSTMAINVPKDVSFDVLVAPSKHKGSKITHRIDKADPLLSPALSPDQLTLNPWETEMVALSLVDVNVDGVDYPLSGDLLRYFFMPDTLYTLDGPKPLFKTLESRDVLKTYFGYINNISEDGEGRTFTFSTNDGNSHVKMNNDRTIVNIGYRNLRGGFADITLKRGYTANTDTWSPMSTVSPIRIEFKTAGVDRPVNLDEIKVTLFKGGVAQVGVVTLFDSGLVDNGKFGVGIAISSDGTRASSEVYSEYLSDAEIRIEFGEEFSSRMSLSELEFYEPIIELQRDGGEARRINLFTPLEFDWEQSDFSEDLQIFLVSDATGLVAHELTHVMQQQANTLTWTPGFVEPGNYHIQVTCDDCGVSRSDTFELVGEDAMKVTLPNLEGEQKVRLGDEIDVEWKVFDGVDGEAIALDFILVNAEDITDRQTLAEKIAYKDGLARLIPGNTITINGENFAGNYYIEAIVHGMEGISGKTQSFTLEKGDVTSEDKFTTSTEPPTLPGFELSIVLISIISIVTFVNRKKTFRT